jgi:hypothetical protein
MGQSLLADTVPKTPGRIYLIPVSAGVHSVGILLLEAAAWVWIQQRLLPVKSGWQSGGSFSCCMGRGGHVAPRKLDELALYS